MTVHWIVVVRVDNVIIGTTGWLLFILGRKYIKLFKDNQADEISVFIGLMTMPL